MDVDWELRESGPAEAAHTVLLLPGGMCSAGSFAVGVSLSTKDEPAFFRALIKLGGVLGGLPAALLAKGAASMVKRIPVSPERQAELREDFRRNVPAHAQAGLREYVQWLHRGDGRARHLCESGVPAWIVHAEKGDGGLTAEERRTLEACPSAHLVTIPGHVFFLPNEVPEPLAAVIREAADHATSPASVGS
jgi:pimeloyl-ACP methyl ester carboxylesterase